MQAVTDRAAHIIRPHTRNAIKHGCCSGDPSKCAKEVPMLHALQHIDMMQGRECSGRVSRGAEVVSPGYYDERIFRGEFGRGAGGFMRRF